MNPWPHDLSASHNSHAGFATNDGAMAFLQPPQTINPAQFQNQPYLNGAGRTASPAFHNPVYQTNQVIPSKRSREDSMGTSPRQASGGLPGSRSQTPGQGAYPGYNPQQNGGPPLPNAPTPYQHLQASSNATPSPTIQQLNFNNPGGPQRVATASPSPFSPQHGNPHASPGPSDHNSRVNTPHDNMQAFMPNSGFPQGFNQAQFTPVVNNGLTQMAMSQMNMPGQHPSLSMAQRNYQMQMEAQARQMQAAQAQRMNGMQAMRAQPLVNPQMAQMQQGNFNVPRMPNPEEFVKGLQAFMQSNGRNVDPRPVICGRQVPLLQICAVVVKAGGSQRIAKTNSWPNVAQQLGFPAPQHAQAAQDLQGFWMMNLAPYENAWQNQQRQRIAQAVMQNQMQNQMSPGRDVNSSQDASTPSHHRTQSDLSKIGGQLPGQSPANNFTPGAAIREQPEAPSSQGHKSNLSRQIDPQQTNGVQAQAPVTTPQKAAAAAPARSVEPEPESLLPTRNPIKDPFKPEVVPTSQYHGPINVDEIYAIGEHIANSKPVIPTVREMGLIDVHALTMAIKSGMHGETRVALDTLVTLSTESALQLSLVDCDDLMDALLECAEDQVDFLVQHAGDLSDGMDLLSYEELVRACRVEMEALQDIPEFGSLAYDLDRAADRLICITTLIRNFSFYEANFDVLGQSNVLKLLSSVIRHIGTREMPLRNQRNTLDFMKDVVIYLSNLSTTLKIPSMDDALCLLHFLLAFAPNPSPNAGSSSKISFTMYSPDLHKYMPSAVDSLAKLLAQDEPNRPFFEEIIAADISSTPPFNLLTRTFGLAIAAVPTGLGSTRMIQTVEARKPFLLQGLLAAEILATLAPGNEYGLARCWLESEDGFAGGMLKLAMILGQNSATSTVSKQPLVPPQTPTNMRNAVAAAEPDANAYGTITTRALSVLRILVQKSKSVDAEGNSVVPTGAMPRREFMLGAMCQKEIDPGILKMLCSYAGCEE